MKLALFLLIVMYGVFVQSLLGFGGTPLAMPLGILVMGLSVTKPVITIVAMLTGVVVVAAEWRYINWRELLKMVAAMLLGVLGGLWLMGRLKLRFLLIIYAVVVAAIGFKKLVFPQKKQAPNWLQNTSLGVAGIIQGLFVSGGSFLAVYAVAKLPEKHEFRGTVNAVWMIIDAIMVISYWTQGALTPEVLKLSGISALPTLAAVWLGGFLAKKVNQQFFLKLVYVLLIVSGTVLLITSL